MICVYFIISFIASSLIFCIMDTIREYRRLEVGQQIEEELFFLMRSVEHKREGLTKKQIKKLKTFVVEKETGECSICIDEYQKNQSLCKLNCNHVFHTKCLKKWFAEHNSCPICRFKIV